MKPVETGCARRAGSVIPRDALTLLRASGARDRLDLVNPYRFREPLAPMVAAERAGRTIDVARIAGCCAVLRQRHRVVLVEGAGGLLVPITEKKSVLDLAGLFGLPLVVVIGSRLGALNHARLTVETALRAGLAVAGAVVNHPRPDRSIAGRTNQPALRRLLPVPVVAEVPHFTRADRRPLWGDARLQRVIVGALPTLLPDVRAWREGS
jgi:dethiobiotin synthetase